MMYQLVDLGLALLWMYSLVSFLYVFQLKEYRADRLFDFLKSKKGRLYLLRPEVYIVSAAALYISDSYMPISFYIFVILLFFTSIQVIRKKTYYPKITFKILLLIVVHTLLFFGYHIHLFHPFFTILYLLYFPIFVIASVLLLQIPTYLAKCYYIAKATKKLSTYSNLKVIGITGSYGKTSTRNYLVQILSTKYKVVTTPKNINTEIGVAKFILGHDFGNDDIFVVEMGAYRKGEIKLIADMVKPQIGIITTIGPEHLALFGSMENIRDAKGELFAALPDGGVAITNSDNAYCRAYFETYKHLNIQTFGTSELQHPILLISNVEQVKNGINATFNHEGKDIEIAAPLFGTHNAMNIAAALLAAKQVGMDIEEIVASASTLSAPPHRLNRVEKDNNVVILDDTYNSNPEGFLEALDILAMQDQEKKVVITRGMLELGSKEAEEHIRIGKRIAEVADSVVIISADNADHLKQGILHSQHEIDIIDDYDMRSVISRYHAIIESGNVAVLLENKVPDVILKDL